MTETSAGTTPPPPPTRRTSRFRRGVLALVIFLGGAACGAGVAGVLIVRSIHHAMRHPEEAPARIATRLTRKLDLTETQKAEVRRIIASRQGALLEIRRDVQPRVDLELSSLESEIAEVLNESQRTKWRELARSFREHWLPPVPATAPALRK